jgi:hypothetical protein
MASNPARVHRAKEHTVRKSNLNLHLEITHEGVDLPEAQEIAGFVARAIAARYGIGPHLHAGNVPVKVTGRVSTAGKGSNVVAVSLQSAAIMGDLAPSTGPELGRKAAARLAARQAAKAAKAGGCHPPGPPTRRPQGRQPVGGWRLTLTVALPHRRPRRRQTATTCPPASAIRLRGTGLRTLRSTRT